MSNEESFSRFVRERRRALDLTQEELARRVGCAAITIRKIEADDLRPSVQIAERLAMALAIPLDDRAEFVRRARTAHPEPAEIPTPAPALEEIGQEDLTGRAIRGYALADRIGSGGMGAVYRAIQPNVEREVAIKIILPAYANHPDFIRRFEAEAQLVARLEHPHIVPLYDYWREPGVAYLVMRLLRGGNIQALIQNGPLPLETAYHLLEQICSALNAAHRIGVIHRDLKPANVLLDEDSNVYLADFGIAKNLGNPNLEAHTQVDVVMGSPQYMSPEQIRSLSVRPQTDIYCLGVMLYEMLTGSLPFTGPTPFDLIQQHINAPMPPLAARRAGLPAALDEVIGRATAKNPQDRYQDVSSLLDDFRRALEGSPTARPVFIPAPDEEAETELVNPYKGLRAFNEADSEDFFGRESLIQQLLARLGEGGDLSRFLAVVGPSGSGKSSVVKAGLLPILRRGGLPGSENWFIVDFMPGPHPFEELEAALLRVAVNPPPSLLAQLRDGNRGLLRAVNRILPADESVELVLVLDQFEEVFTLITDEKERALLLTNLVTAVLDERSRMRLVITLRADFTDRPLRYVDFGELVQRRSEFVMALTPDELERAILGPAKRVGLRLEAGLTSAMIREVGDQPGALPLLQYALTELFEKREGRALTKKAYADLGGVTGALGKRTEAVYAGLNEAEQSIARQLFLRLVTVGEGVEDTRRRVLKAELEQLQSSNFKLPIGNVLDSFGAHRLLSFDRDPITRGPTVEVAHEALLREWPRLREWLNESRADVRLQRQLAAAATEWQAANRDSSFLLTGAKLEQFEGWAANTSIALTHDERAFLDASIAERGQREAVEGERQRRELEAARKLAETERRAAQRLRQRAVFLTVALIVAGVLAVAAVVFGQQATQNAQRAEQQARLASSREWAAAAVSNVGVDPDRSILLALQAVSVTYSVDKTWTGEAEEALHRAVSAAQPHLALRGHSSGVSDVAFSPDGTRLATASLDGTAKIWDATTGQELFTLPQGGHAGASGGHGDHGGEAAGAPGGELYSVAFNPAERGTRLATAGQDGTVTVWDISTAPGEALLTLGEAAQAPPISAIAFSPDGTRLAAASTDGTVRVWDLATERVLLTLSIQLAQPPDYTIVPHDVAFSPDGTRLATVGPDNTARVWDAVTGEELLTLAGHNSVILDLAFSPDGQRLATASFDATAKVWDAGTGDEVLTLSGHTARLEGVVFSPDGMRLATVSEDGTAKVWDASVGQELFTLAGHASAVKAVAFSPDGARIATASTDETARVWEAAPSRELFTLVGHTNEVYGVAFNPDGTRLATSSADRTAKVWDAASGQLLFTLYADLVEGIAFNRDGTRIATGGWDGTAKIWDATSGQLLLTLSGHSAAVGQVEFSPDGTRLATTSADKTARLWDVTTGQELLTLSGHAGGLHCLAFSPDGTRLLTGGDDDVAIVWDLTTGQELFRLPIQTSFLTDAAYSPDGTRLLTADTGETAKVWDAATGQLLMELSGHAGGVWGVAFNPDGTRLATTSADKTAKVWDAVSGQELLTLYGHAGTVYLPAFSPDGMRLVTTSADRTARVYVLPIEDLIALAQSRVTRSLTAEECQQYLHVEVCPAP
ncbi:MAG: protein kinase [Chloroflexi bacterium]|nr:protein kinase [Chloroflexota bacterium]